MKENKLLQTIWLKPTQTLKFILEHCPDKFVTGFLILGGVSRAIDRASNKSMGDTMDTWLVLTIAILAGGVFGWVSYYIYAWAMSYTGKWLKGKAESDKFKTILAWSLVPTIASLLLLVPELIIFGDDLFRSEISNNSDTFIYSYVFFALLEVLLAIWSIVILVKGISIIQNFTIGKSILNMFLPGLVILIPIIVIALIVRAF
ncbi:MAG: YIP1 family protein [Flavobacteriaceae bacterium]|nr:YIP1 family protein [Flavobacteriaceae bacterium]